ncbi:arylsulfatase J-like isoform X2 [Haliotis asinina]|uniref:arylsulfatase J-like isoform X2 n=1 Tax=Haliotis asinina TaxID=109174 RepID=UPI0035317EA8
MDRTVLLLLSACCTALSAKPNIIFIFADDYGYHDVGYHNSDIKTPVLDQLAAGGVKLENYYVQPLCSPSRSQFMSGRYQIHTGLQHGVILATQPNALPLGSATIADKMKDAGYSTYAVGKWHLGFYKNAYLPTNRGFDSFYGYLTGKENYYTHSHCDFFNTSICGHDLRDNTKSVFTENGHYSTHLFTEKAIDIIQKHDKAKPFFLYLAYQSTHIPLQVPSQYMDQYSHINDTKRRTFAGMTTCMDEGIGNVTAALKASGQLANTLIVFSADNGGQVSEGASNWPLRGTKGTLWEGGIRAVGFVYGDMLKNKGTINRQMIHVSDWFPTLVGMAGGNTNGTKPLDGFDQWKTIRVLVIGHTNLGDRPGEEWKKGRYTRNKGENSASPRTEILHNIDPLAKPRGQKFYNNTFDTRIRAAIRVGKWKLITGNPDETFVPPLLGKEPNVERVDALKNILLFNIPDDPSERHDVSAANPDVVKELLNRLANYQKTAVTPVFPDADPKCDPKLHGGVWTPWE